jgi:hypothetical protein
LHFKIPTAFKASGHWRQLTACKNRGKKSFKFDIFLSEIKIKSVFQSPVQKIKYAALVYKFRTFRNQSVIVKHQIRITGFKFVVSGKNKEGSNSVWLV